MYPEKLKYTKDHEWIQIDGDTATIGITDFAQKELGDVVFVELPEVGRRLAQNEEFGTIESVKAVSEIYSPVSGEVLEVNSALQDKPETVNEDPYGGGWILKLRVAEPSQVDQLMDAAAYEAHTSNKGH